MISKVLSKCKKYGLRGVIATLGKKGQIIDKDYRVWFEKHRPTEEILKKQRDEKFLYTPVFSIVVPVYNTPEKFLEDMILSVQKQSYGKWELCIANADPSNKNVTALLRRYAEKDARIKLIDVPENLGIAQNTNAAISLATGDYVGLLDHDDMLSLDALYEVTKCLNEKERPEVIYTDEDKVTVDGKKHFQPNFKPEFNLDMLRSNNYICHFFVVKRSLLEKIGGVREEYNGAQDHDLIFRCTEQANRIVRIPKILYHWRMHDTSTSANPSSKKYAYLAGIRAIDDHLKRCGEKGNAEMTERPGFYRVKYQMTGQPLVTIIVINSDNKKISADVLERLACEYGKDNIEICIVDQDQMHVYERLKLKGMALQCIYWSRPYQYSEMLSLGIEKAKSDYILLLSPFVTKTGEKYIEEFVANIERPGVGIVGGKLYYPNGVIKNAGMIMGRHGGIDYVFEGLPKVCSGYMNRQSMQQNLSVVSFENAMIRKSLWVKYGSHNSNSLLYNSVEWCKRIRDNGYLVVYNPYVEAISINKNERESMGVHREGDPFYNPNLGENYSIEV